MGDVVIDIQNLNFAYNRQPVLIDVNLTVQAGEFIAMIGPNGGGKTTLLKLMLGLLKADSGRDSNFRQGTAGTYLIGSAMYRRTFTSIKTFRFPPWMSS